MTTDLPHYPPSKEVIRELLAANPSGMSVPEMVEASSGRLTRGTIGIFLDQMYEAGEIVRLSPSGHTSYLRRVYWRYKLK